MTEKFSPPPLDTSPTDEDGLIRMPTEEEFSQQESERTAREANEHAQRTAEYKTRQERLMREKWKGRMKKVMAATALLATVKSGGFIDMAADPFVDSGEVAASAIAVPKVELPDELDGITFEDYPADAQAEYIAEETSEVERESIARESVIALFERADSEGYDGIVAEVAAEKQAHPELYVSNETSEQTKQAIEDAETNAAAIDALNDFMASYDIDASFHDTAFDDKQGELKKALKAYVDVFSVLPKDFIAMAEVQHLTVSDKEVSNSGQNWGSEGGSYSPDEGSINIVVRSGLLNLGAAVEGAVGGDDYAYQSLVGHELGHALGEHHPVGAHLDEGDEVNMEESTPASVYFSQIARNQLKRPEHMSMYARTDFEENTAEVLSGVLSDRDNGLATTDEWRRFGSGANKSMIDMLAQLEAVRPGIAQVLVANRLS